MAEVVEFESDKVFTRTHFNNFGHLLVFVFYAEWNQPSLKFKDNLLTTIPLFGEFPNVKYFTISAQKCPESFKKYGVEHTPTVLFTQTDKKVIKKFETEDVGLIFDSLAEEAEAHLLNFQQQKKIWHPKVKSILNESPVIVFIKGTPANPKCGFTSTMLNLLAEHQIEFTFYDIIEDQYMRYWLRNYGGWATYPQIYSQGKLIGGLDVCKDLVAKGEFLPLFPKSCRVPTPEDKFQTLIQEHPLLVFIDGFSFEANANEAFLSKVKESHKQVTAAVYNLSLDQSLKKYVLEVTKKSLPLLLEGGQVKEL